MLCIYKPVGATPLAALNKLRQARPELKNETLSYAGRLDPMAEGVLLVISGDENKERGKYLGLNKEYEVEILFGFSTDSYDILGMPRVDKTDIPITRDGLADALKKFEGAIKQQYPPYSSKPVLGKPLHEWARAGKLQKITRPEKTVLIHSIKLKSTGEVSAGKLQKYIQTNIARVAGDFRQEKISASWREQLDKVESDKKYITAKIKIACGSGAYMRAIADDLGRQLKTRALALSIKRTRVGKWGTRNCITI